MVLNATAVKSKFYSSAIKVRCVNGLDQTPHQRSPHIHDCRIPLEHFSIFLEQGAWFPVGSVQTLKLKQNDPW